MIWSPSPKMGDFHEKWDAMTTAFGQHFSLYDVDYVISGKRH